MEPLRGTSATVKTVKTVMIRMLGDLPVMYAQGGLTAVFVGTILGIAIYQLRSRGVTLSGGFSQL
ncbi:hypothetical protein SBA4_2050015 [Candidatus Sulfopaludibacter sp. SbA4]|nr:hypothetical protein SBA4_2050015 [Candidatus Sulfopaludibacter sp. SbA4]